MDSTCAKTPSLFILVSLAVVLCALWAVHDARRRRKPALFVVIAVVFFFPFGLIAWLLFRPPIAALQPGPGYPLQGRRVR